jgi:hypothetical protein
MMELCGGVHSVNLFELEMGSLLDSFEIIDSLILKLNFLDRVVIFSGLCLLMKEACIFVSSF